jgi:3-oxoacyl-[acyl-carrier protein] reductase
MNINLAGRTALVTGATGQLGRAMVRTLAECGADVAVHYRNNEGTADELVADVRAIGRRAMKVQADVTDAESVAQMHREVTGALGDPDIVVPSAHTGTGFGPLLEKPAEDYAAEFAGAVLHNVMVAKAFLPAMIEKHWGRIVAINTECSMQALAGQSAYAAAKRGLDGVLRALAREVGRHGITVNQVAPGWISTDRDGEPGSKRWQMQEDYAQKVPLRRRGTPQDVANADAFLASDLADFITGLYLPVCGGNVMPTI